jgi:opacity protein-like surface antigen
MSEMSVSTDQDINYYSRVHIGITAEFTAGHYLSVEAGLFSSPKGFRTESFEETSMGIREDKYLFGPNYSDVFINAKFTYDLDNFRIFGFAGPFFAIGTGGKEKTKVYYDGDKTEVSSRDLSWGSGTEDDIRKFDFGFAFGTGAEFRAFQLRLFYQVGLPDVSPSTESWEELKNRVIGISVGFRFSGS